MEMALRKLFFALAVAGSSTPKGDNEQEQTTMKNFMSIACQAARYGHFIAVNRPFARTKGFVRGVALCPLVLGWLLTCPSVVHALINSSATAFFGDDVHTSILAPMNYVTNQTPWVNTALSNWVAKASTPGWNFSWVPSGSE